MTHVICPMGTVSGIFDSVARGAPWGFSDKAKILKFSFSHLDYDGFVDAGIVAALADQRLVASAGIFSNFNMNI